VVDLLEARVGPVEDRAMFGGVGLFRDGLMFALLFDDTLYLKTDACTQGDFEAAGLEALQPFPTKKRQVLSYHRAPDDALDDPDGLVPWVEGAMEAARRAARRKGRAGGGAG
jgi:DNA transformation protein